MNNSEMDISTMTASQASPTNVSSPNAARDENIYAAPPLDVPELKFELGLWLSGLESYLQVRNHAPAATNRAKSAVKDWSKELRLVHATLLSCSKMSLQLANALKSKTASDEDDELTLFNLSENAPEFTIDEISALAATLKDAILLNEALLRAAPLSFGEWSAYSSLLTGRLKDVPAIGKLIARAEREGERFLPKTLQDLLQNKPIPFATEADLRLVLPRFAKVLKWLDVIAGMHAADAPLKPTLLLFARIREQIQELTNYVNNRLLRFTDESDELFGALDAAIYALSMEVRKVYGHELVGLAEIRQTPAVYAKIETSLCLLTDSFQQTLVSFAQLIEPSVESKELFPNLQTKFEQSLALRQDMWEVLQIVREAEAADKYPIEKLHGRLTAFAHSSLRFLMYKDWETVERFIEEVLRTRNKSDLVSILHRFGAYLETLLGQVNMRVVLANHPFEPKKNLES